MKVGASVGGILGGILGDSFDDSVGGSTSSILEDLRYLRIMASSVEDGSPSHGDTSGESSKESIPLMDGEVPEGVPRGEPLTKAAADRSTVETHTQLSP